MALRRDLQNVPETALSHQLSLIPTRALSFDEVAVRVAPFLRRTARAIHENFINNESIVGSKCAMGGDRFRGRDHPQRSPFGRWGMWNRIANFTQYSDHTG
jgi:hypothetical protein